MDDDDDFLTDLFDPAPAPSTPSPSTPSFETRILEATEKCAELLKNQMGAFGRFAGGIGFCAHREGSSRGEGRRGRLLYALGNWITCRVVSFPHEISCTTVLFVVITLLTMTHMIRKTTGPT